ncbi:MAG: hypothetical protein RIM99_13120 [Cyclobacteriaceae bacterium]
MRKKLFTAMIILAAFGFTACQEDDTMQDLIDQTELNQTTDPDPDGDDGDADPPTPPPANPPSGQS